MKKLTYLIISALTAASLISCEKEFTIRSGFGEGMVFLKFVPSNVSDTTFLSIQQTTPLNDSRHPRTTEGESVAVSVNGSPVNLTKQSYAAQTTGPQNYLLKRRFAVGDKVEVRGSIPGAKSVESSFTVPTAFPEYSLKTHVEGLDEYFSQICFDVEYENTPESSGCYGLAVLKETTFKSRHGIADAFTQTITWGDTSIFVGYSYEYPESIGDLGITSSGQEPMVFYSYALDRIFGRRESPNILAWKDAPDSRNGKGSHQIRVYYEEERTLGEMPPDWFFKEYGGTQASWDFSIQTTTHRYKLILYSFSEELYNYLKADYNMTNNELSEIGLSPASFTYTNVKDGIGVCGAYTVSESDWIKVNR